MAAGINETSVEASGIFGNGGAQEGGTILMSVQEFDIRHSEAVTIANCTPMESGCGLSVSAMAIRWNRIICLPALTSPSGR
ncbi:hypothetical protein SAMN04487955_101366 [Halomonas korlensis]|uniref:Uncharacterized protein n=1 Tax=Halomonas korlensis TaxID=463301 RepID=A0A1I7FBC7_9GAMM|nr:hypothetical protein SAMN04487955_101366 [Halomonas korlensis]